MNSGNQTNFLFRVISLIVFSVMISCTNNQNESKSKTAEIFKSDTIHYADFWDAILSLDTSYTAKNTVTKGQLLFSDAIKLMLHGKNDDFIDSLKKLYINTNDTLIRDNCYCILSDNFFNAFKWSDLLELDKFYYSKQPQLKIDSESVKLDNLHLKLVGMPKTINNFCEGSDTVPFLDIADNCPVIQIKVNGKKKNFLFDTGCGLTAIFSDITKECNVSPVTADKFTVGTATSKCIYSQYAACNFDIGKLNINQSIITIDNAEDYADLHKNYSYKIDGIIGWEIIKNMDVVIDYYHKILIINKPVKRENEKPNLFYLGYPIVSAISEQGTPLFFGFDTGANSISLTPGIKKKIKFKKLMKRKIKIGSAGGFEEMDVEIVPEIALLLDSNKIICKEAVIDSRKLSLINLDGVFGGDIAQKTQLRFDYTNGIFEFNHCKQKK